MTDNNGNSYPSPPSSSNSPNVTEERLPPPNSSIPRRATLSVVGEASRETQRHLQQTSAALDAAYNRIRQVRRSLLELSESLPATISQLRLQVPGDQFAPGHDAILLSPSPEPENYYAEEQAVGNNAREREPWNRVLLSSSPEDVVPRNSFLTGNLVQSITDSQQLRANPVPNSNAILPTNVPRTFARMRINPSRRDTQGDDGSTLLGRRVAARIAVTPSYSDTAAPTYQLIGGIGQIYEGALNPIASVTNAYDGELERVLRALDERRRNLPATPSRSTIRRTSTLAQTSSQVPSQVSPHLSSQGPLQPSSQSSQTHLNPSSTPQRGLGSGSTLSDTRQNSGPSERLSLLSNFSVQNFPTLAAPNLPSRPLIFDEPLSYVQSSEVDPTSESGDHPTSEVAFHGRNYVVHRTYNQNGEEVVHNITVDWDDGDPQSWLMPSSSFSRRHRNRINGSHQGIELPYPADTNVTTPPPQDNNAAPRRRGWARLDLDGNEIPSEEEEEVERIRTEDRIRASQRAQVFSSLAHLVDLTTPPPAPPQRQLTIYQTIKPPVVLRHDPSLSYPADFVNPLPMPLSEMVDSGKNPKPKAKLLPRHVVLAGR